jgi:hypothetical protein
MTGLWIFGARSEAVARLSFETLSAEVRRLVAEVSR